jgi:NAD-dependent dihydropyrimidine dehydrogenase PreA subunit
MLDAARLKERAKHLGIDLVGIAPIERFGNVEDEEHPQSINPDTKSVIVLGFQLTRGSLRGVEEGTAWHTMTAGNPIHPMIMVELTYLLTRWIEMQGWEATPVFPHPKEMKRQGLQAHPNRPAPDVILNMDYAAHAAGLGRMGIGKFFLTHQFGPRQVFCAILTDAATDQYDAVAERTVCDECGECVRACPMGAYAQDRFTTLALCEGEASWHLLKVDHCLVCSTGKVANPYIPNAEPWRVGAACGRACVAHLEDQGLLATRFAHPFRSQHKTQGTA